MKYKTNVFSGPKCDSNTKTPKHTFGITSA